LERLERRTSGVSEFGSSETGKRKLYLFENYLLSSEGVLESAVALLSADDSTAADSTSTVGVGFEDSFGGSVALGLA
jgi:hypothetical protein